MNLLIDCELTAPPSEIGAFRTLTLYATVFYQLDCLIEAKPEEIDYYYNWLKRNYACDFVKQFVNYREVSGKRIVGERLTYNNLNQYLKFLK